MPWSGSGTFSRKTTTVSPATSGTTVDSADMNSYTTDVTNGINAARTKNGENAATANLPMGGFKHTNVAAGTARTEYASVAQGQDGSTVYAADTGAADAYVVTLTPAVTSNVVGRKTSFKAANTNTGASTLNLNAIGAESIKQYDGDVLLAGDITATRIYTVTWDGTNYILDRSGDRSIFVNASDGGADLDSTSLDLDSVATVDTWESVGPTGSSADNIWSQMDAIPSGVDWVEIMVYGSVSKTTTTINTYLSVRKTGSSRANSVSGSVFYSLLDDSTSNAKTTASVSRGVKIPVDSSMRFDVYRHTTNTPSASAMTITLTGYGWN